MEKRDIDAVNDWFDNEGVDKCSASWQPLQELYIDYILYTKGRNKCSAREFGSELSRLGCECKRVSGGMVYRYIDGVKEGR